VKDPIEEALEKLKPGEMPLELMARLTAARSRVEKTASPRNAFWRRWLVPLAAGSCAAAIALAFLKRHEPTVTIPPGMAALTPMPFERQDFLLGTRDVGMLVAPNHRPYRVVEIEWLEQDTVRPNLRGPAVLVETTRREIIPVALEIF
jgi:hypothetical protein